MYGGTVKASDWPKSTALQRIQERIKEKKEPVKRLAIVQESGFQLGPIDGRYEKYIYEIVIGDDLEFGKQRCAQLNENTDLPFYLVEIEVLITGKMEEYTTEKLLAEGIEPFTEDF